jgi:hypothetical protein
LKKIKTKPFPLIQTQRFFKGLLWDEVKSARFVFSAIPYGAARSEFV